MTRSRCTLPLLLALALVGACDNKSGAQGQAAKVDAKKADDKKADAKKTDKDAKQSKAGPHGNPHAGMAMGPHGAGAPPKPKGPPRDITPTGETRAETLPGLSYAIPTEWESNPPSNRMRLAQFVIPGPGGDAELVIFRFPGGGGAVQANLDRWKGQFKPPEGKTIDDVATTREIEGDGLKTTLLDVSGTFVAAVRPGEDEKHNDADYRMLAAIVEGSGNPYFFKAVGPVKTVDLWATPFETMVGTFKAEGGGGGGDAKADDKKADDNKADAKKADAKKADDKKAPAKKPDAKKAPAK